MNCLDTQSFLHEGVDGGSGIHYSLKILPIIHLIKFYCLFIKTYFIIHLKNYICFSPARKTGYFFQQIMFGRTK